MSATADLTPVTAFDSPHLDFDFPGLKIGCAEYEEGPTGCTVFAFAGGVETAVDCFAGGSLHGLEAISGVRAALTAMEKPQSPPPIPLVAGAIIYDWFGRENMVYPDKVLGAAAMATAAEGRFFFGQRGAGRWAGVGQGGAYRQLGATKIAVFTVVNALGDIVDRDRKVRTRDKRHPLEKLEARLAGQAIAPADQTGKHTTLTLVATNQQWSQRELDQIGRQVHSSMAQAIQPFHTIQDGDILFTATTGAVENEALQSATDFGLVASELAWDAVLNSLG